MASGRVFHSMFQAIIKHRAIYVDDDIFRGVIPTILHGQETLQQPWNCWRKRRSGPSARRFFDNESLDETDDPEAMTEADNVPNYQRRVLLRAVTFNNLCCCLAGPTEDWAGRFYGFAVTAVTPGWVVIINEWVAGQGHKGFFCFPRWGGTHHTYIKKNLIFTHKCSKKIANLKIQFFNKKG